MKILFLCNSLEPGKCGVGDYVRILAGEIQRRGHSVAMVACSDSHIALVQEVPSPLLSLRLPTHMSARKREKLCAAFVGTFSPDWISAQIVVYGWQRLGLPAYLPGWIKSVLNPGVSLHLMFHELSLGLSISWRLKHRFLGLLQRELVLKRLARLSAVRLVHANIPAYTRFVCKWGTDVTTLPLFGNIPFFKSTAETSCAWWNQHFSGIREDFYVAGIFGSFRDDMLSPALVMALTEKASSVDRRLMVALAGRLGSAATFGVSEAEKQYGAEVVFVTLGDLAADDVSLFMQQLDVGIAATPWDFLGKSSSVASMLEHGLTVVVPCEDPIRGLRDTGNGNGYPGAIRVTSSDFKIELNAAQKQDPFSRLDGVTTQLLKDLGSMS